MKTNDENCIKIKKNSSNKKKIRRQTLKPSFIKLARVNLAEASVSVAEKGVNVSDRVSLYNFPILLYICQMLNVNTIDHHHHRLVLPERSLV